MEACRSVTFEAPFNLPAWQIMAGAEPCENCGTSVAQVGIVDDNDNPMGEHRLAEMVDPPHFGRDHTPTLCAMIRHGRER